MEFNSGNFTGVGLPNPGEGSQTRKVTLTVLVYESLPFPRIYVQAVTLILLDMKEKHQAEHLCPMDTFLIVGYAIFVFSLFVGNLGPFVGIVPICGTDPCCESYK